MAGCLPPIASSVYMGNVFYSAERGDRLEIEMPADCFPYYLATIGKKKLRFTSIIKICIAEN